ncbi:cysteine hydrolase family protein [Acidovorax sp.]|jgi:nicotinamidase-related amidase|uniref:cysteine hydrolase family protein n=1 Tax=Acidovorax sp. TaxID=1872122 RepID=UPI00391F420A
MPTISALLVIDVQRGLCEGEYRAFEVDQLIARVNALTTEARVVNAPVVFIQHEAKSGPLQYGSEGWHLALGIKASPSDILVRKTTPDSFLRTNLEQVLKQHDVGHLVICGLQTEYCVDTTTRRALALGYPVTLVADAHSTLGNEHLSAAQIIRHHNDTLSSISSFGPMARLMPASEVRFGA